jgi:hypothetical protein
MRIVRGAAVVVVVALIVSMHCGRDEGGAMAVAPPPPGWADAIAAERSAKNEEFRTSRETPLLRADVPGFRGLDYWPADPSYRLAGAVRRDEKPERFTILSTTGKPRPCEKYGSVAFELRGKRCRLRIYRLLDIGNVSGVEGLFLPFTDGTTGRETYPAGRYVDLAGPEGGPYVLDFNRAYNPLCAYGAPKRFACPVTPSENRLPLRVEAGERGYKRHGGSAS